MYATDIVPPYIKVSRQFDLVHLVPYQVFEFAEAVDHAARSHNLLLLDADVDFVAHPLQEFIDLCIDFFETLQRLPRALDVWTLTKHSFEPMFSLLVDLFHCDFHDDLESVPLFLEFFEL